MGRPRLLDDAIQTRICTALRGGASVREAAMYGGVQIETFHKWVQRGHRYADTLADGADPDDSEEPFRAFAEAQNQARADARMRAVLTVTHAVQDGDVKAAQWWLERRGDGDWSPRAALELTGAEGGPLRVADVTDTERRLAADLSRRVATVGVPDTPALGAGTIIDAEVVDDPHPVTSVPDPDDPDEYEEYAWAFSGDLDWTVGEE